MNANGEDVAMRPPTLFLTVGLPATGKTTAARRIEVDHRALRLTKDEWMKALYGDQNPSAASDVIEGRLIDIGLRALELGSNVVLDFGLWSRDERSALRQAAADRRARVHMQFFEVPPQDSADAWINDRPTSRTPPGPSPTTSWPSGLASWRPDPGRGRRQRTHRRPTRRVRLVGPVARGALALIDHLTAPDSPPGPANIPIQDGQMARRGDIIR